jgi:hypothetical protein
LIANAVVPNPITPEECFILFQESEIVKNLPRRTINDYNYIESRLTLDKNSVHVSYGNLAAKLKYF